MIDVAVDDGGVFPWWIPWVEITWLTFIFFSAVSCSRKLSIPIYKIIDYYLKKLLLPLKYKEIEFDEQQNTTRHKWPFIDSIDNEYEYL